MFSIYAHRRVVVPVALYSSSILRLLLWDTEHEDLSRRAMDQ